MAALYISVQSVSLGSSIVKHNACSDSEKEFDLRMFTQ